jgi:hypothetical protein
MSHPQDDDREDSHDPPCIIVSNATVQASEHAMRLTNPATSLSHSNSLTARVIATTLDTPLHIGMYVWSPTCFWAPDCSPVGTSHLIILRL